MVRVDLHLPEDSGSSISLSEWLAQINQTPGRWSLSRNKFNPLQSKCLYWMCLKITSNLSQILKLYSKPTYLTSRNSPKKTCWRLSQKRESMAHSLGRALLHGIISSLIKKAKQQPISPNANTVHGPLSAMCHSCSIAFLRSPLHLSPHPAM